MKRLMNLLAVASLAIGLGAVGQAVEAEEAVDSSTSEIKVVVEGKEVEFPDAKPYLDVKTGRTMVPVRFVSEALGGKVTWDGSKNTVKIDRAGEKISLKIGEKRAEVANYTKRLDAPAILRDSRTYVPLRFVSESLNQKVEWDEQTRVITITALPPREPQDFWLMPYNEVAYKIMNDFYNSVRVEGNTAIIQGPTKLHGSKVTATDLRAGAALVLAGLIAEGETEIQDIHHIERGYSSLIDKLCALGANIRKETITVSPADKTE